MISIIIPVYNGEKTIGECLSSLENQTKKPGEIIVVDDGSSDKTKEIVKKHKEVKLLEQKHRGPACARNLGAKKAKGEILLFTDADCMPDREWVSEMSKAFNSGEISGAQGRYRTKQKGLTARFVQMEIEDRYDRMKERKYIDFIGSYSAGYRKNVFMKSGGFDESFRMASGEDPELSFKLSAENQKMIFSDSAVVFHNHVDSLGAYLKQKFWRAYWRVLLYKKHPGKITGESYTPQTLKFQIVSIYVLGMSLILSLVFPGLLYISIAFLAILIILTLPLSGKNARKDIAVGLSTPFFSVLRTVVFALGLILGVIKL